MNTANLNTLIDALKTSALADLSIGFNMAVYIGVSDRSVPDQSGHDCGSVACIAGYAIQLIPPAERSKDYTPIADSAARWLDIGYEASTALFLGGDAVVDATATRWSAPDINQTMKVFSSMRYMSSEQLAAITVEQAVDVLEHLRDTGIVDWRYVLGPIEMEA